MNFNPGMASRFQMVQFEDFDEDSLLRIFKGYLGDKWKCEEKVAMVAVRRLAKRIGSKGFGNARAGSNVDSASFHLVI
jgi:hypothetical protein